MDMNLQKYLSFVKTVEYGSFTRAAAALNYTQPGISRMIGDLEREWGVVLLERGKGGVRLTSDGVRLLPCAQQLVAAYGSLQAQVDELRGLQSGLIRIGTFSSAATHWLPNIIRSFQRDYPSIDYELLLGDYTEIERWVREGRVDCGFLSLPAGEGLESIFLEEDPLMAVLPEGHPLAELERVPIAALCEYPFMLLEKGAQAEVTGLFQRYGLRPRVHFTTWDDYAIMSMAENGLGVSILPRLILRRVPYRVAIRPLDVPASRRIGLVLREKRTASVAVRRFLDYLDDREGKI